MILSADDDKFFGATIKKDSIPKKDEVDENLISAMAQLVEYIKNSRYSKTLVGIKKNNDPTDETVCIVLADNLWDFNSEFTTFEEFINLIYRFQKEELFYIECPKPEYYYAFIKAFFTKFEFEEYKEKANGGSVYVNRDIRTFLIIYDNLLPKNFDSSFIKKIKENVSEKYTEGRAMPQFGDYVRDFIQNPYPGLRLKRIDGSENK